MRQRLLRPATADLAGAAIAACLALWVGIGAGGGDGRPAPLVALLGAAALSFAAGRCLTERLHIEASALVALGVAGSLVFTFPGLLESGGGPLGYANSNATLAALGAVAAASSALSSRRRAARAGWMILAMSLAAAVVMSGSVAGLVSLVVAVLLVAISGMVRRASAATLGGPIVVLLALALTAAIGHGATIMGLEERSVERAQLWASAADLAADQPLRGVGIGRFANHHPISPDRDLRWAHNEYLQLAAEGGVVALALLLALVGWGYGRLSLAAIAAPGRAMLGAAALTLLALHATVDHVAHDAAVPLAIAALIGGATGRCRPRSARGSQG
jgi:O-antigen ligase